MRCCGLSRRPMSPAVSACRPRPRRRARETAASSGRKPWQRSERRVAAACLLSARRRFGRSAVIVRECRPAELGRWILLQLLEGHFDRLLELWIATLADHRRILLDLDIGRHSDVLDLPLTGEWERSEEHTSELQSLRHLVCRLLLEKKKKKNRKKM